jgi:hypothetical protein
VHDSCRARLIIKPVQAARPAHCLQKPFRVRARHLAGWIRPHVFRPLRQLLQPRGRLVVTERPCAQGGTLPEGTRCSQRLTAPRLQSMDPETAAADAQTPASRPRSYADSRRTHCARLPIWLHCPQLSAAGTQRPWQWPCLQLSAQHRCWRRGVCLSPKARAQTCTAVRACSNATVVMIASRAERQTKNTSRLQADSQLDEEDTSCCITCGCTCASGV